MQDLVKRVLLFLLGNEKRLLVMRMSEYCMYLSGCNSPDFYFNKHLFTAPESMAYFKYPGPG
jgi:hypothetical protein